MERFEPFWINENRKKYGRVVSDEILLPNCYKKMLTSEPLRIVTRKGLNVQKTVAAVWDNAKIRISIELAESWSSAIDKPYDLAVVDAAELPVLKEKSVATEYIVLQPVATSQGLAYIDEEVCDSEAERTDLRGDALAEILIRLKENTENRMNWQEYTVAPSFEEVEFDALPKEIKAGFLCTTVNGHVRKTFCFYGLPRLKEGEKRPAVVLVHGAGGNAFYRWVEEWVKRGYAAISIDINCTKFEKNLERRVQNSDAGELHIAGFDHVCKDPKESWVYYAVSQIISANSFLRELPCVDKTKIGIVGISWGGVMSLIALGADSRFALGGIIYSAGFITEDLLGRETHIFGDYRKKRFYDSFYDASNYVGSIRVPVIMNAGLQDGAFSPFSRQRTYRLMKCPLRLAIQKELYHDNESNFVNVNVGAFFDYHFFGKKELATLSVTLCENHLEFSCDKIIKKATLCYAEKDYAPHLTPWKESPARVNGNSGFAVIPETAIAYTITVYYGDGLYVSSKIYGREQLWKNL